MAQIETGKTIPTRTVRLMVVRQETWYPEYEVPAHMDDVEAAEYIENESPSSVYDESRNKVTLDTEIYVQIISEDV